MPQSRGINLVIAPRFFLKETIPGLISHLAQLSSVRILDGGNSIDVHLLARELQRKTGQVFRYLDRIELARAFTCYQMLAMLLETPASPSPIVALELLATFYDENVAQMERKRLFTRCVSEIVRLSQSVPVLITISNTSLLEESIDWLGLLKQHADRTWHLEKKSIPTTPRMF